MKIYLVNGEKRRYPDGKAPDGAVLLAKAKKPIVKAQPVKKEEPKEEKPAVKTKARKTQNKARKAASNK